MKDKYTVDKCALTAKLMREGESKAEGDEDDNIEDDDMSEEEEKKGKGKKAGGKEVKQTTSKQAKQNKYEDNEDRDDDSFDKGSTSKKNKKAKKGHTVSITKQDEEKKPLPKQVAPVTQPKKASVFANFNNDSDEEDNSDT